MSEIKIFTNPAFGEVRTAEENGKVLFCGSDVAKALGYAKPQNAVSRHCKGALKRGIHTNGGVQVVSFIPESDVYRLVFSSKLPNAEAFTDWVAEEVLPTIRKTGGYVGNEQTFVDTYLPFADEGTKALFSQTLAALRQASAKIEADKPKALFADSVSASHTSILVGELAKLIKQNGVDIGQNRLFEWLRENGFLIKRKGTDFNMPTQRSMELGLFEIKETVITHSDGHITVNKTPKISGKGQLYFVERFLGDTSK